MNDIMPNPLIMRAGQAAVALIMLLAGSPTFGQTRQKDDGLDLCVGLEATTLSLKLGVASLRVEAMMADGSRRFESLVLPLQVLLQSYPPPARILARESPDPNRQGGVVVMAEQDVWIGLNATGGFEQSKTVYLNTVQRIAECYPGARRSSQSNGASDERTTIQADSAQIIISRSSGASYGGISSVAIEIATRKL